MTNLSKSTADQTAETPIETGPRTRRLSKRGWIIVIVALIIVTPVLLVVWMMVASTSRVESELNAIRKAGLPVTGAEMEAYYDLPTGAKDCTQIWLSAIQRLDAPQFVKAAQALPIIGESKASIPLPGEAWADLQAAQKLLAQFDKSLKGMHEAARHGGAARYPTRFSAGIGLVLPHAQIARLGARLLTLDTHVQAHLGDTAATTESILAIISLAESFKREPVLISQLIRYAINSQAQNLVLDLLPVVQFSDDELARLQSAFRAIDYRDGFRRGLIGDRVLVIGAFHNPAAVGIPSGIPFMRQSDFAFFLDHFGEIVDASDEPLSQGLQRVERIQNEMNQVVMKSNLARLRYLVTFSVMPASHAAFLAHARGTVRIRSIDVAIAAEQFRRTNGHWPSKMANLVPKYLPSEPIDPYDGKPLRYKIIAEEPTIYSVFKDRVDDGGVQTGINKGPDFVLKIKTTKPEPEIAD